MSKRFPSTKNTGGPYVPQLVEDTEGEVPQPARYVTSTRKLVAGEGLLGGGDLSKDRKFDIDFGEGENQAVRGNDPRLSDSRDWNAPLATEEDLESSLDEPRKLTPADLFKAFTIFLANSGIAEDIANINTEATKNSTDAFLLNRSNHTGTQPISSIAGLQNILDALGSSFSGHAFSVVRTIELLDSDEYVLTATDIGRTLIINSVSDKLNIKMNACFGSLGDEIYIVAPRAFLHDPSNPINFFTEISLVEQGGGVAKVPPVVATGLVPSFYGGRAIVCLKKCFTGGVGMDDWLLFGDLATEVVQA